MEPVQLTEIPRESSRREPVVLSEQELDKMFEGLKDFRFHGADRADGELKLQRIGDHVRLAGWVMVPVAFECGRCLSHREVEVEGELEYMLIPRAEWTQRYGAAAQEAEEDEGAKEDEGGLGLSADDLGVAPYEGDAIDARPFMREALLVELPMYAMCPDELQKECDQAFEQNMGAKTLEENEQEGLDPRWAALAQFKK